MMSSSSVAGTRDIGEMPINYPILTPSNYTTWVMKVQPKEDLVVHERMSKMAIVYRLQMLAEEILLQVVHKKTKKEIWDCLKTRFVGAARERNARLSNLKNEFDAVRMKEGETLEEYVGRLSGMSARYASLGGTLEDAELVKKLLNTTPVNFYSAVAGIEQLREPETMSFEEAVARLKTFNVSAFKFVVGRAMENSYSPKGVKVVTKGKTPPLGTTRDAAEVVMDVARGIDK